MKKGHIMLDSIAALKTDERTMEQLRRAAEREPEPGELFEQRVSFVFGSIKARVGVTRDHVRQAILEQEKGVQKDQP